MQSIIEAQLATAIVRARYWLAILRSRPVTANELAFAKETAQDVADYRRMLEAAEMQDAVRAMKVMR